MGQMLYSQGFSAESLSDEIISRIDGVSYHENSEVKFSSLAYLKILYYDFDHKVQSGELIVNVKLAEEVLDIFYELYEGQYELEKVRLVDCYGADDDKSMADNNTSAFNYRVVADTNIISDHSYGRAIDINPLINPYIVGEKVMPANAVQYCDRNLAFPHKITHDDLCFRVFERHGWKWGGDWDNQKDYQHFYKPVKSPVKAAKRHFEKLIGK